MQTGDPLKFNFAYLPKTCRECPWLSPNGMPKAKGLFYNRQWYCTLSLHLNPGKNALTVAVPSNPPPSDCPIILYKEGLAEIIAKVDVCS